MKKLVKNSISFLLILGFLITPYFTAISVVNAQYGGNSTSGGYSTGFNSGSGAGISGYITGLAPAITQLPLCKDKINSSIKTVFKGVKNIFTKKKKIGDSFQDEYEKHLTVVNSNFDSKTNSVQVYNEEELKLLKKILEASDDINNRVGSLDENDTCLKSIGRMVVKMLLQKITMSTVDWIKNGFEGDPAFLQNPGEFFHDIARTEILEFGAEISDPKLYPFGKAFMKAQAEAFNTHFQDNARYSLNELIQETTPEYSDAEFKLDFSKGGWNAWTAMTSVPANNPLGFQIIASNELSRRLQGTYNSTAEQFREDLSQAAGYLGDNRCADPKGMTKEEDRKAIEDGDYQNRCKRWEYVTPGQMVAESATKLVHYPDNNLLKADDLNDAIGSILDALLARFSSDLMNKGFADFSNQGADGKLIIAGYNASGNIVPYQTEKDFSPSQISSWLSQNPNFNIRTDITQGLIDEQRIYIQKLKDQNKAIPELIKTIRQLDYCIPGPNPLWESASSVDEFYRGIKFSPSQGSPVLPLLLSFDPTGIISGIATALLDDDRETEIKKKIARYVSDLLNVNIFGAFDDGAEEQDQILNEEGIRSLLENIFELDTLGMISSLNSILPPSANG